MWPGHAGEVSPCPVSGADVPGQAGVPQGYCHVQGALGQNTGVLTAWVGVRVRGESEVVITREWTEPRTSIYGMSMFYFGCIAAMRLEYHKKRVSCSLCWCWPAVKSGEGVVGGPTAQHSDSTCCLQYSWL